MKPLLLLNFKNFSESTGDNAVKLAQIVEKFAANSSFEIAIAPSIIDLPNVKQVVSRVSLFSQHVDLCAGGICTGGFPVTLAKLYCSGTLLNHAERQISLEALGKTIANCKENNLKVVACANSISDAQKIVAFAPDFIAVEPLELIGTGISVSTAQPELVTNSVKEIKKMNKNIGVLVGAGISTASDVKLSIKLGADGALVASRFSQSKKPEEWLEA
ncbi:MAG: triose-phosphate isomerase, partial [Candidatus Micrarchaeota archaeon]